MLTRKPSLLSAPPGSSPGAPTYREVRLLYENDRRGVDQDHAATILGAWPNGFISCIRRGTTSRPAMTDEERAAFAAHAEWLGRLLADGC
jgi:hypothetical protein